MDDVARVGRTNACNVSARKPEGKRPLGRLTCSWKDNIKMDHETKLDVDWIHLVHGMDEWRVCVDTVINFQVPQNAGFD